MERNLEGATLDNTTLPDERGHFGKYGGLFVAETLMHALDQLNQAYEHYKNDAEFLAEYAYELQHFVGRPSPVYHAKRWSEQLGGAQIWFKREDLNHTGAHKVNYWRDVWAKLVSLLRRVLVCTV